MRRIHGGMAALSLAALLLVSCGDVGDAPKAETGEAVDVAPKTETPAATASTYTIDTTRSKVEWVGAKVTNAHDGGFRVYNGTVAADNTKVTGIDVKIDARSIWSDDDKLTGHLKSPDFFAVEQYPDITFQSSSVEPLDSASATASHRVTGNLTMRGQTKGVTFPAKIDLDGNTVHAVADFKVNRKDWGIVYAGAPDDLISDDVRIKFDITAVK